MGGGGGGGGGPTVYTAASETLAARLHNTALWANTSACAAYDSGFYNGSSNNSTDAAAIAAAQVPQTPPQPTPQPGREGGTCTWLYNGEHFGWQPPPPSLFDWPMGNVDLYRRLEHANLDPK
ncbi:unnamed protein product [Schistocephalus solidus]|uniref:Dof-type domain-containing protein n=1 Tax=Schistocephalus solidus TaxID=70667 RepID=A0A183TDX8_SCHSO|nr:unnamed protein product [Schistocephalus solidus]